MGRPRQHGPEVRDALLDAAEALLVRGGAGALSVRAVADGAGTTTRAVYSVFGSKNGLLTGLAQRVFEVLGDSLARLSTTGDPAQDLVEAAVQVFRAMAVNHRAAYRITFLGGVPGLDVGPGTQEAAERSLGLLHQRFERLRSAGRLAGRSVPEATFEFHAFCEGLATLELRRPELMGDHPEDAWRRSIATLISGLAVPVGTGHGARSAGHPPTV